MRKIHINYERFILENVDDMSDETRRSLVKTFLDTLDEATKKAFENEVVGNGHAWGRRKASEQSYSAFAILGQITYSFEDDFKRLQEQMDKEGWTPERIQKLFATSKEMVLEMYEAGDAGNLCGIADNFLYHYWDGFVLSGMDIDMPEEAVIKFLYGWHKTTYGKAAFDQAGGENFSEEIVSTMLPKALVDNEYGTYSKNWRMGEWELLSADYVSETDEITLEIRCDGEDLTAAVTDIIGHDMIDMEDEEQTTVTDSHGVYTVKAKIF
jgi:hypothetical protein